MTPAAVLSILVKTQGAQAAAAQLGTLDKNARTAGDGLSKTGEHAKKSSKLFSTMGKAAGLAGITIGAAGLAAGVKSAVSEFREAQKVGGQTNAVLKSTGGAANVTKKHIENLAGAISKKVGIDDEEIQSNENMLLTFTNLRNEVGKGNDIFDQATQTVTDMSVALGQSGKSSAIQLGKALNDPIKGITALRRVGVSFTEQQQKQIETLVKSGDTLGAQKLILKELNKEFSGSAAAQATSGDKLKVALGNLSEAAGAILVPALDKVARFMTNVINQFVEGKGIATVIIPVFQGVAAAIGDVVKVIAWLVNGFRDGNAVAVILVTTIASLTAAFVAYKTIMLVAAAASQAMARAQVLINIAMTANPIVLVIVALAALAAGLVIAYEKSATFRNVVNTMWDVLSSTFGWVKDHWPLLLAILTGPIGLAVREIVKHAGDIKSTVVGAFTAIVNAVHGLASAFTGLGGWVISKIVTGATAAAGTVTAVGGWIKNRVVEGVEAAVGGFTGAGTWIINRVAAGVTTLTDTLSNVGGWIKNRIVELLHNEVDSFGALGSWLVDRIMSGVHAAGKAISDAAEWLKDQVVNAVKKAFGIDSPSKVMMELGGHLASGLVKGVVGGDVGGFIKKHLGGITSLASSALGGAGGALAGLFGLGGGGKPGKVGGMDLGSGGPAAWLKAALTFTGHFSDANFRALWGRMMQESGGDPHAINLWDSNAKAGHPSRGLLQTIPTTFAKYRDRRLPDDIYNPIANAVAAINYMYAVYGHIVGPSSTGYASGTSGAAKGWAWVGERGPELVNFRGGERVLSTANSFAKPAPKAKAKDDTGPGDMPLGSFSRFASAVWNAATGMMKSNGAMPPFVFGDFSDYAHFNPSTGRIGVSNDMLHALRHKNSMFRNYALAALVHEYAHARQRADVIMGDSRITEGGAELFALWAAPQIMNALGIPYGSPRAAYPKQMKYVQQMAGTCRDQLCAALSPETWFQYGQFAHPTGYAAGTAGARRGLAWVGERGPELMSMRGGERVYSNTASTAMAGGVTVVHEHHYNGPVVQDKDFIQYLRNLDRNYGRQNGRPAFGA